MKKLMMCAAFIAAMATFTTAGAQDVKTKKCPRTEQCCKQCANADCKKAECKDCKCGSAACKDGKCQQGTCKQACDKKACDKKVCDKKGAAKKCCNGTKKKDK